MSVNVYEDISEQTTKWNEEEGKSAIASILLRVVLFQVHTLLAFTRPTGRSSTAPHLPLGCPPQPVTYVEH